MNLDARIHAIGWSGLYSMFNNKVSYLDLLPFPNQVTQASDNEEISQASIDMVRQLNFLGLIPRHVLIAIAQISPKVARIMQGSRYGDKNAPE